MDKREINVYGRINANLTICDGHVVNTDFFIVNRIPYETILGQNLLKQFEQLKVHYKNCIICVTNVNVITEYEVVEMNQNCSHVQNTSDNNVERLRKWDSLLQTHRVKRI